MTEKELRTKVADWLNSYKGIKEGSTEHKKLISIFNDSGLCSRYKMTVNDPWCAMAASCPFIDLGLTKIAPFIECSCANMITLAKNAGVWVEDDTYTPGIGDLLLYDWDDGSDYATTDNKNTPDHVGIVQNVSGTSITVIEGNKDDTVGTRSVKVNGRYIRGYITPDYASVATADDDDTTLAVGDIVNFTGTKHYTSANATSAKTCKGGMAEVTQICKGAKHPYHLIHLDDIGTVYGWVDADDIEDLSASGTGAEVTATDPAESFDASIAGTYKTTTSLYMRNGAGKSKKDMVVLPGDTSVRNYGYYTVVGGIKWLYVQVTYNSIKYTGFCCETYLSKQ